MCIDIVEMPFCVLGKIKARRKLGNNNCDDLFVFKEHRLDIIAAKELFKFDKNALGGNILKIDF